MFERILIPLDGSETAEAILPQVRRILKRHRAEVLLVRAVPAFPPELHLAAPALVQEAQEYVRGMAHRLMEDAIPARGFARLGSPGEIILDTAERERATLIAMSTHGRTGLPRWVFGSVAEKVLRASPVPMLLLRSYLPHYVPDPVPSRAEELPFHTLLVPLDGSPCSMSVIPAVEEFARSSDTRVILVNVVENDPYAPHWTESSPPLEAAQKELISHCIPIITDHRRGDPAEEILKASREHRADAIAMSTHGRSGPSRWVFGSVAEKVLREAAVPMLMVRNPKDRAAHPARTAASGSYHAS